MAILQFYSWRVCPSKMMLIIISWRAEEAVFTIVVAVVSNEDSEEYDRFLKSTRQMLQKEMRSSSTSQPLTLLIRSHCFCKCDISCIFIIRKSRSSTLLRRINQNHPRIRFANHQNPRNVLYHTNVLPTIE